MMSKRVFLKRNRWRFWRPSCIDCFGDGYTAAQVNSPPPPATASLSASILNLGNSPAGNRGNCLLHIQSDHVASMQRNSLSNTSQRVTSFTTLCLIGAGLIRQQFQTRVMTR